MKIKYSKQIAIYAILFLVVICASVLIFIKKQKTSPTTADSVTTSGAFSFTGSASGTVGDTVNVVAKLDPVGNLICLATFTITYPADLLELKSSSFGTIFYSPQDQETAISAGSIHYMLSPRPSCTTSDSTLLNMSFTAKAAGSGNLTFSAGNLIGGEVDGMQPINSTKSGKAFTIAAPVVVTPPTSNSNTNVAATNPNPTPNIKTNTNTNTNTNTTSNKKAKTNTNTNSAAAVVPGIKNPTLETVAYSADVLLDSVQQKAKGIVFSGTADPDAKINIIVASNPISASTQSDASGNWTYTLTEWLETGVHTITLTSEKSTLKSTEIKTQFVIGAEAKDQIAIGTSLTGTEDVVVEPATETTKPKAGISTIVMIVGATIGLLIIVLLAIFISKRRHYLKVTKKISGSIKNNAPIAYREENQKTPIPASDLISPQIKDQAIQGVSELNEPIEKDEPLSMPPAEPEISKPVEPGIGDKIDNEVNPKMANTSMSPHEETVLPSEKPMTNHPIIAPMETAPNESVANHPVVAPVEAPEILVESPEIKKEEMTIGYKTETSMPSLNQSLPPVKNIQEPTLSASQPVVPNSAVPMSPKANTTAPIANAAVATQVHNDKTVVKKIEALVEPEITFDQEYIEQDSANK